MNIEKSDYHCGEWRQRGISLIEGVLYLVIALAVIIGGIVFFQQAQRSAKITETARVLTAISSQMMANGQYIEGDWWRSDAYNDYLVKGGFVPGSWVNEYGNIEDPWGEELYISADRGISGELEIDIEINNAPDYVCMRLTDVGYGNNAGSGVVGNDIVKIAVYSGSNQYIIYQKPGSPGFIDEMSDRGLNRGAWIAQLRQNRIDACQGGGRILLYYGADHHYG